MLNHNITTKSLQKQKSYITTQQLNVPATDKLSFEQLPNGKYRATHVQSGIRIARSFTEDEAERSRDWTPPDLPPPKSNAIAVKRGLKLLQAADAFLGAGIDWDECPSCGSCQIDEILTPGLIHYGKLECMACGQWIKWLSKPGAAERREELKRRIDRLIPKTVGWDLRFLKSIAQQLESGKNLSPKQLAQVDRIETQQGQEVAS